MYTFHHFVEKVKRRKEVDISYMKSWEIDEMNREEGRQEGRLEGRLEGIEALITAFQELQHSYETTLMKVREKFSLSQEDAETYLRTYWK